MARETGAMITYADAQYMVNNEGYSIRNSFTSSNEVLTRQNIENCLCLNNSEFTSYASNELVPYQKLNPQVWYALGASSSKRTDWGFHRLWLYYPDICTKIAIFDSANYSTTEGEPYQISPSYLNTMVGTPKQFNSDNGYQNSFIFDTTGVTSSIFTVAISGIPNSAVFQQVYANYIEHTGLYKNADLSTFFLGICNPTEYLRLDGMKINLINFHNVTQINALHVRVDSTSLFSSSLDNIIQMCDANGKLNGTLNYSNISMDRKPTSASRAAYDSLLAKGWNITGAIPGYVQPVISDVTYTLNTSTGFTWDIEVHVINVAPNTHRIKMYRDGGTSGQGNFNWVSFTYYYMGNQDGTSSVYESDVVADTYQFYVTFETSNGTVFDQTPIFTKTLPPA